MNGTAIYRSRVVGRRVAGRAGSLASIAARRKIMRKLAAVLLIASAAAHAQTIEMRQVGVLVDRDGKGFTRAPMTLVPVGKLFAMTEMNELPLVVDSAG